MAEVNPIFNWDRPTLKVFVEKSVEEAAIYTLLSKTTHVAIIAFGIGGLATFGMTNPSYFSMTGTLLIIGYGPACEVSVKAWDKVSKGCLEKAARYRAILENLNKDCEDVPELLQSKTLIAQWHALAPIDDIPYTPPPHFTSPDRAFESLRNFEISLNIRRENLRSKILRAYLIHVANHPFDLRKISDFGEFHSYQVEHLHAGIPFAFFKDVLNTTIEKSSPRELSELIFSQA